MATFVQPNEDGYIYAGNELRAGRLIAFPTETVYGLGANALDPEAVLSIFKAKGRPLTDPLIVHVPTLPEALELVDLTPKGHLVFECLGRAFWPGPLTLIAKATATLPLTVSAHTGFVGIRCPSHPIAQTLLQEAKVPVAAPSANRFGHVSPTSAQHVMDDLGSCSYLGIVDDRELSISTCQVGIESTVVKILPESNQLLMYRRGGVSEAALALVLEQHAAAIGGAYEIVSVQRTVQDDTIESQPAPGQLLTHYAPDVDTYLYQPSAEPVRLPAYHMKKWVVLDFNGQLAALQDNVLAYHDLSKTGDVLEASQHIFEYLRWAEHVADVERVVMTDALAIATNDEHAPALHDRMFRAASGKIVHTLDI